MTLGTDVVPQSDLPSNAPLGGYLVDQNTALQHLPQFLSTVGAL